MITVKHYQEAGFNKLRVLSAALLAAKCRYGKTYVTMALSNDWDAKLVVVMSGYNVRTEWAKAARANDIDDNHIIYTAKQFKKFAADLKANDFKLPDDKQWLVFVTSQKLTRDSSKEEINEEDIPDGRALNKLYKEFAGSKLFVVDECQFFEQTDNAQEVISSYTPTTANAHLLYLSATPYRESIKTKFSDAESYYWSYEDEWKAYEAGELDYKPIQLEVRILNACSNISLNEDILTADWLRALKEPILAERIVGSLITNIKLYKKANHLAKCRVKEVMFALKAAIEQYAKNHPEEKINVESTEALSYTSDSANKFFAEHRGEINIICTAEKLGVGTTMPEMYSVSFLYAVKSPIDLTQTGFRSGTQEEDDSKEVTGIIMLNKFNALDTIRGFVENNKGNDEPMTRAEFEEFTRHLPILTESDEGFKAVDFADVASTRNYKKGDQFFGGPNGYFSDIEDAEAVFDYKSWLDFNNIEVVNALAADCAKASKKSDHPVSTEEAKEIIKDKLAHNDIDGINSYVNSCGSKKTVTTAEVSLEKVIKQMEEAFINGTEESYDEGSIIYEAGSYKFVDENAFNEAMMDQGFREDFCTKFVEKRPDILTGIVRTLRPLRGY